MEDRAVVSPQKYKTVSNELRLKNIFCDAVLKVEDEEFPVHKFMLCQSGSYFRAFFENWAPADQRYFTLGGLSAGIMSLLLEWIYTGSTDVSQDTVEELVLAADMLLLDKLVEICFQFLIRQMCPDNCIGIWKFCNVVVSEKMRDISWRFILSHFEEVVDCEEFLELTEQELREIIEDDGLNVKDETRVFEAVVRWTEHNVSLRTFLFPVLLSQVRLAQTSYDFLKNHVLTNPLVKGNYLCLFPIHLAEQTIDNVLLNPGAGNFLLRPRLPESILLAIGGWSASNPTNGIEAYNHKRAQWINITDEEERPRAYHGSVFLNGSVYCMGGFDRTEHFSSMRRLDLATRAWDEMPPMYERRCYVSATVLNGRIYAVGGYNGRVRLNTAEVFDPQTNRWSLIAPMNEQRSDAKCATLNGSIYICGGFNGSACLQTAECYNAESNQWTFIAPMSVRRSGVAVIAYENHIYAVGGFDGSVRLSSVEAYNPDTNSWRQVASMNTARSNFGIEVLDGRIFAVGGYNGFTTTYATEAYDHLEDRWSEVTDMAIYRSALDCCVISGLPNMREYATPRDIRPLRHPDVRDLTTHRDNPPLRHFDLQDIDE